MIAVMRDGLKQSSAESLYVGLQGTEECSLIHVENCPKCHMLQKGGKDTKSNPKMIWWYQIWHSKGA